MITLSAFTGLNLQNQLFLCVLLVLPAGLDWISQAFGLRESSNFLRGVTGFLEGTAVALFSTATASLEFKFGVVIAIGGAISILGLIGKKIASR